MASQPPFPSHSMSIGQAYQPAVHISQPTSKKSIATADAIVRAQCQIPSLNLHQDKAASVTVLCLFHAPDQVTGKMCWTILDRKFLRLWRLTLHILGGRTCYPANPIIPYTELADIFRACCRLSGTVCSIPQAFTASKQVKRIIQPSMFLHDDRQTLIYVF